MGRKNTLASRDNVFKVARQLLAEGESPTNTAVREKLGGGSYREIAQHLTAFRKERDEKEKLEIPHFPEIEALIKDAAKDIALLAHRHQQQAIKDMQEAAVRKLEQAESVINENVQIVKTLEQEVDDLEVSLKEARRQHDVALKATLDLVRSHRHGNVKMRVGGSDVIKTLCARVSGRGYQANHRARLFGRRRFQTARGINA